MSELREALEEYTVPLETDDPTVPVTHADAVSERLDGRIIALGEATHGTREFFRLKHRLFGHLVEERGARVFAIEANFPESLSINEYVLHGEGDPKEALENIYFWTWNVDSVLSLIEWMREFNEGRPLEDRVRFYGFDSQYSSGAVTRLQSYLDDVDVSLSPDIEDALDMLDDDGTTPDDEQREQHLAAWKQVRPELEEILDSNRDSFVECEGERAWELARRCLTVLGQVLEYREAMFEYEGEFDGTNPDEFEALLRLRDEAMADNVDWLLDFEETEPLVLWAHDAHINREKHHVRGTGAIATPMGRFLSDRHGQAYVPVGFSFGRGSFQAFTDTDEGAELDGQTLQSPVSGTIDETFDELESTIALVDITAARSDERLDALLDTPHPHFSAGATYDPSAPEDYLTEYTYGDAFDMVCYVAETTRARPVDADIPEM
jgi:erythromycin esterase